MAQGPTTPRDLCHFTLAERAFYDGMVALARATGMWRFPMPRQGDFARMGRLDIAYWLYKAQFPIERASRGSDLEGDFAAQAEHRWALPEGFEVEQEVTLSAVGDLFCHDDLGRSRGCLYEAVADRIFGADLAMANLECLILPDRDERLAFRTDEAPRLYLDRAAWQAIRGHEDRGYDFVATANNHSLDFGTDGMEASLAALDAAGIVHHGINRSEEDRTRATIVERKGIRIGLLSWTFGVNGQPAPADRPRIVNCTSLNAPPQEADLGGIDAQIRAARARGCDFVVAHLHWGMEHERYPRPEQVALAHALAERGVDAIIGHHPHLVQPLGVYRTARDHDRAVPIHYSLGNLTSHFRAPFLCEGGLGRLVLAKGICRDGRRRTYVASASLEGLRQQADDRRRTLRLLPTGPISFAGR